MILKCLDGPFVWTVMPTHGQNMIPLERRPSGGSFYTILVLEDREDVKRLLKLLERPSRRERCEKQSMSDLAASGGIVDAP